MLVGLESSLGDGLQHLRHGLVSAIVTNTAVNSDDCPSRILWGLSSISLSHLMMRVEKMRLLVRPPGRPVTMFELAEVAK